MKRFVIAAGVCGVLCAPSSHAHAWVAASLSGGLNPDDSAAITQGNNLQDTINRAIADCEAENGQPSWCESVQQCPTGAAGHGWAALATNGAQQSHIGTVRGSRSLSCNQTSADAATQQALAWCNTAGAPPCHIVDQPIDDECPPNMVQGNTPDGCRCPSNQVRQGTQCGCPPNLPIWDAQGNTCRPPARPQQVPVQAAAEASQCPAGMHFIADATNPRCECNPGMHWLRSSHTCVPESCSGGAHFDEAAERCVCPDGRIWSAADRTCIDNPCAGGTVYDPRSAQCVCPSSVPRWNASAHVCEACPGNLWWTGASCACPGGMPILAGDGRSCLGCPPGQVASGNGCVTPCNPPCNANQVCVNHACIGYGPLRFTLTWDNPGDLDLHVVVPSGEELLYSHPTGGGGRLDRDDTSGTGPENIFWDAEPPAGHYVVCVVPYGPHGPTNFSLAIARGTNIVQSLSGHVDAGDHSACAAGSAVYVTAIDIP